MSTSKTSIGNLALLHLKNSKSMTDIDSDASAQSLLLLAFWDIALGMVLEDFDWPFAKTIAALALIESDPDDGVEWAYSYTWPSDCKKPRYIVDGNLEATTEAPRIAFEEGADGSVKRILTNEEDAILAYTKLVTDVTLWSDRFSLAFSYKLAALAASTLAGGDPTGLGQKAEAMYEREMSKAKAFYLNMRQRGAPPESEFITGR